MLKNHLISDDAKKGKKIISLVNLICRQIHDYNILHIGLNPLSCRYFSAFYNPIMAGRIGREMDLLQTTQSHIEKNLEILEKMLAFTHSNYCMFFYPIEDGIKKMRQKYH